jgi:hypothetical protein
MDDIISIFTKLGYATRVDKCNNEYSFVKGDTKIGVRECVYTGTGFFITTSEYRYCGSYDSIIELIAILGKWDDDIATSILSIDILDSVNDYKIMGGVDHEYVKNMKIFYIKYIR